MPEFIKEDLKIDVGGEVPILYALEGKKPPRLFPLILMISACVGIPKKEWSRSRREGGALDCTYSDRNFASIKQDVQCILGRPGLLPPKVRRYECD